MGAHTTTDDPTRYRLSDDLEHWKLKDPIARVKAYLRRNGLADEDFFDAVEAEADELGDHLREGCGRCPTRSRWTSSTTCTPSRPRSSPSSETGFAAYLESFEGSH